MRMMMMIAYRIHKTNNESYIDDVQKKKQPKEF